MPLTERKKGKKRLQEIVLKLEQEGDTERLKAISDQVILACRWGAITLVECLDVLNPRYSPMVVEDELMIDERKGGENR